LACKGNITKEDLAGLLYDSLRNKVMKLPDECIVYPGLGVALVTPAVNQLGLEVLSLLELRRRITMP